MCAYIMVTIPKFGGSLGKSCSVKKKVIQSSLNLYIHLFLKIYRRIILLSLEPMGGPCMGVP